MIRVQFTNSKAFYDVEFSLEGKMIKLKGKKFPKEMKGFKAYRRNGKFLGDYSTFTHFEETKDGYLFKEEGA